MSVSRNIIVKESSTTTTVSRPDVLAYLASNRPVTGSYTNYKTATFNRGWYIAPSSMPLNSVDQFDFYVNGSEVEQIAITSFTDLEASSVLEVDTAILGYSLESNDTIVAIGKFS
jgi:hypothetical protein